MQGLRNITQEAIKYKGQSKFLSHDTPITRFSWWDKP